MTSTSTTTTTRTGPPREDHGVLLADAMSVNAVTSGLFGLVLAMGGPWLATLLGAPVALLIAVGGGLVGFAAAIVAALAHPPVVRRASHAVIFADAGWVLGSALVIVGDLLTVAGDRLVAAVGVMVSGFAVAQAVGLRRAGPGSALGTRPVAVRASRVVAAPVDRAWALVADAAGYAAFAPGIARVTTSGDLDDGMVRTCTDAGGRQWSETCSVVAPGRTYRMDVDTTSYPLRYRSILHTFGMTWDVTPTSEGTRLQLTFSGTAKLGILGRIAMAAMATGDPAGRIIDAYAAQLDRSRSKRP